MARFAYFKNSLNQINCKIMNSQTSTNQTRAQSHKKTAESVENISAMKRLLKIKTYKMTLHLIFRHVVSGSFEKISCAVRIARVTSSEEQGTMSKKIASGVPHKAIESNVKVMSKA